ncbi:MAG: creatininase family protein [Clostridia bacterium]|nr:creatininase family protein [Clostridia bacterium]
MRYIDKTGPEIALRNPRIAILPLGSFEQHGPHLPLGTDNILVEAVAEGVAERLGAFQLPVQPITTCYEHHGKKGSVHYSADVFYRYLVGIMETLIGKGFRKIVLIPGHGGIFVLEPAVRYVNAFYRDSAVVFVDPYEVRSAPDFPFDEQGIHADDMETSLMLYIRPDLVDMSKAVDCIPEKPRPYLNYGSIFTHSPSGVWGYATRATAEKGKWLLEKAIEEAALRIQNLFAELAGVEAAIESGRIGGDAQ